MWLCLVGGWCIVISGLLPGMIWAHWVLNSTYSDENCHFWKSEAFFFLARMLRGTSKNTFSFDSVSRSMPPLSPLGWDVSRHLSAQSAAR